MGRKEQAERKRRRAAKTCHTLEGIGFLPAKRPRTDDEESLTASEETGATQSSPKSHARGSSVVPSCPSLLRTQEETGAPHSSKSPAPGSTSSVVPSCKDGPSSPQTDATSESDPKVSRSCCVLETQPGNDIGAVFLNADAHTGEDCQRAVDQLSDGAKYALLRHHRRPPEKLPSSFLAGCNRTFQRSWLRDYPWMVYSMAVDGAFCASCALFCRNRSNKGQFVNSSFRKWHKKNEKCTDHEKSTYHQESLELADQFRLRIENPDAGIAALVNNRVSENIERNRKILRCIADAILYCGRQCIALRGHREKLDSPGNPGNFLSLLKLLSRYDDTLQQHLASPSMAGVTYMSPQIQNEIIEIIGQHVLLRDLLEEIRQAKFYAVLADEVVSSNIEHLAICLRFVDANCDIREEFLTFQQLQRITGKHIAEAIIEYLEQSGLQVVNIRGQGYDGASNMSSSRVGVQGRIQQLAPLATYTHCSGHCLNLVISHACGIPEVRNVLDRLKNCCRTFLESPKKNGLLEAVVGEHVPGGPKRKALLDLCRTRWAERQAAYQHFYQAYCYIVEALEVIGHGMHMTNYGETYGDWDSTARSEAQQLLASITRFDFIVVFLMMYFYLSHLADVTVKLQGRAVDIIAAHQMIGSIKDVFTEERSDVEEGFKKIYEHAVRMATSVGTNPAKPRATNTVRQQHRNNAPAVGIEEFYRRNCVVPFLDYIINDLDSQFSPLAVRASSLLGLVPSVICSTDLDLAEAVETYSSDLPSPELVEMELTRWRSKFARLDVEDRPATLAAAVKECDPASFPNLHVLLRIACTLPVTSCECERSASALRRLRNYMRATMTAERQTNLALMHIHYDQQVDLDEVVSLFARLHRRRLELDSIVKPS